MDKWDLHSALMEAFHVYQRKERGLPFPCTKTCFKPSKSHFTLVGGFGSSERLVRHSHLALLFSLFILLPRLLISLLLSTTMELRMVVLCCGVEGGGVREGIYCRMYICMFLSVFLNEKIDRIKEFKKKVISIIKREADL